MTGSTMLAKTPPDEALVWPEGDDEVAYDLDDWDESDRESLSAALRAERIAFAWHGDEVAVPERFADVAEELIDAIDHPDAIDEDDEDDDGGAEVLGALYVASDVLTGDPGASGAVIELLELAPGLAGRVGPLRGGRPHLVGGAGRRHRPRRPPGGRRRPRGGPGSGGELAGPGPAPRLS